MPAAHSTSHHSHPLRHPSRHPVRYPVLQLQRIEMHFACGSHLWLQQLNTDPLVRVIEHDGHRTAVDLRRLCPGIEADYTAAAAADRAGVIFFTVRQHFTTREAFINTARQLGTTAHTAELVH